MGFLNGADVHTEDGTLAGLRIGVGSHVDSRLPDCDVWMARPDANSLVGIDPESAAPSHYDGKYVALDVCGCIHQCSSTSPANERIFSNWLSSI